MIFLEPPLAKSVDLWNKHIIFICHRCMVTLLHSSHFQVLLSFTTILHSTGHTVPNQAPVPAKDCQVLGHSGQDMTSTKVVMAGLKCSTSKGFKTTAIISWCTESTPAPPGNNPVNRPTSCSSTPPPESPSSTPKHPSGRHGWHPIRLPTKIFQPSVELRTTNIAAIEDLPPLPELSYNKYEAYDSCNDLLDLGGAQGNAPMSLKQTEFSLKEFAKKMEQPNYSAFNKGNKVWVARFIEKRHRSIILGQSHLKPLWDRPLNWELAVIDFMALCRIWLQLKDFNIAEWIWRQWVVIVWSNVQGIIADRGKRKFQATRDRR